MDTGVLALFAGLVRRDAHDRPPPTASGLVGRPATPTLPLALHSSASAYALLDHVHGVVASRPQAGPSVSASKTKRTHPRHGQQQQDAGPGIGMSLDKPNAFFGYLGPRSAAEQAAGDKPKSEQKTRSAIDRSLVSALTNSLREGTLPRSLVDYVLLSLVDVCHPEKLESEPKDCIDHVVSDVLGVIWNCSAPQHHKGTAMSLALSIGMFRKDLVAVVGTLVGLADRWEESTVLQEVWSIELLCRNIHKRLEISPPKPNPERKWTVANMPTEGSRPVLHVDPGDGSEPTSVYILAEGGFRKVVVPDACDTLEPTVLWEDKHQSLSDVMWCFPSQSWDDEPDTFIYSPQSNLNRVSSFGRMPEPQGVSSSLAPLFDISDSQGNDTIVDLRVVTSDVQVYQLSLVRSNLTMREAFVIQSVGSRLTCDEAAAMVSTPTRVELQCVAGGLPLTAEALAQSSVFASRDIIVLVIPPAVLPNTDETHVLFRGFRIADGSHAFDRSRPLSEQDHTSHRIAYFIDGKDRLWSFNSANGGLHCDETACAPLPADSLHAIFADQRFVPDLGDSAGDGDRKSGDDDANSDASRDAGGTGEKDSEEPEDAQKDPPAESKKKVARFLHGGAFCAAAMAALAFSNDDLIQELYLGSPPTPDADAKASGKVNAINAVPWSLTQLWIAVGGALNDPPIDRLVEDKVSTYTIQALICVLARATHLRADTLSIADLEELHPFYLSALTAIITFSHRAQVMREDNRDDAAQILQSFADLLAKVVVNAPPLIVVLLLNTVLEAPDAPDALTAQIHRRFMSNMSDITDQLREVAAAPPGWLADSDMISTALSHISEERDSVMNSPEKIAVCASMTTICMASCQNISDPTLLLDGCTRILTQIDELPVSSMRRRAILADIRTGTRPYDIFVKLYMVLAGALSAALNPPEKPRPHQFLENSNFDTPKAPSLPPLADLLAFVRALHKLPLGGTDLLAEDLEPVSSQTVVETPHPYTPFHSETFTVRVPGATLVSVQFDPRSCTLLPCDTVAVSADFDGNQLMHPIIAQQFPKGVIVVPGDSVTIAFAAADKSEDEKIQMNETVGPVDEAMYGFRALVTGHRIPSQANVLMRLSLLSLRIAAHVTLAPVYRPITSVRLVGNSAYESVAKTLFGSPFIVNGIDRANIGRDPATVVGSFGDRANVSRLDAMLALAHPALGDLPLADLGEPKRADIAEALLLTFAGALRQLGVLDLAQQTLFDTASPQNSPLRAIVVLVWKGLLPLREHIATTFASALDPPSDPPAASAPPSAPGTTADEGSPNNGAASSESGDGTPEGTPENQSSTTKPLFSFGLNTSSPANSPQFSFGSAGSGSPGGQEAPSPGGSGPAPGERRRRRFVFAGGNRRNPQQAAGSVVLPSTTPSLAPLPAQPAGTSFGALPMGNDALVHFLANLRLKARFLLLCNPVVEATDLSQGDAKTEPAPAPEAAPAAVAPRARPALVRSETAPAPSGAERQVLPDEPLATLVKSRSAWKRHWRAIVALRCAVRWMRMTRLQTRRAGQVASVVSFLRSAFTLQENALATFEHHTLDLQTAIEARTKSFEDLSALLKMATGPLRLYVQGDVFVELYSAALRSMSHDADGQSQRQQQPRVPQQQPRQKGAASEEAAVGYGRLQDYTFYGGLSGGTTVASRQQIAQHFFHLYGQMVSLLRNDKCPENVIPVLLELLAIKFAKQDLCKLQEHAVFSALRKVLRSVADDSGDSPSPSASQGRISVARTKSLPIRNGQACCETNSNARTLAALCDKRVDSFWEYASPIEAHGSLYQMLPKLPMFQVNLDRVPGAVYTREDGIEEVQVLLWGRSDGMRTPQSAVVFVGADQASLSRVMQVDFPNNATRWVRFALPRFASGSSSEELEAGAGGNKSNSTRPRIISFVFTDVHSYAFESVRIRGLALARRQPVPVDPREVIRNEAFSAFSSLAWKCLDSADPPPVPSSAAVEAVKTAFSGATAQPSSGAAPRRRPRPLLRSASDLQMVVANQIQDRKGTPVAPDFLLVNEIAELPRTIFDTTFVAIRTATRRIARNKSHKTEVVARIRSGSAAASPAMTAETVDLAGSGVGGDDVPAARASSSSFAAAAAADTSDGEQSLEREEQFLVSLLDFAARACETEIGRRYLSLSVSAADALNRALVTCSSDVQRKVLQLYSSLFSRASVDFLQRCFHGESPADAIHFFSLLAARSVSVSFRDPRVGAGSAGDRKLKVPEMLGANFAGERFLAGTISSEAIGEIARMMASPDPAQAEQWDKLVSTTLEEATRGVLGVSHILSAGRVTGTDLCHVPEFWLFVGATQLLMRRDPAQLEQVTAEVDGHTLRVERKVGSVVKVVVSDGEGQKLMSVSCSMPAVAQTSKSKDKDTKGKGKAKEEKEIEQEEDILGEANEVRVEWHASAAAAGQSSDGEAQRHCRFCEVLLTDDTTAKCSSETPETLANVCNDEDCMQRRDQSCVKQLECGHACYGIRDEEVCPPCFEPSCAAKSGLAQDATDYCTICWTEPLGQAPVVQLECGHVFHRDCVKQMIAARWNGARITFSFAKCPLCKTWFDHPSLAEPMGEVLELFQQVKQKALLRLTYDKLEDCEEIKTEGSPFYQKPEEYALDRYSYYMCSNCRVPYYGGLRACGAAPSNDFDPADLICTGCCWAGESCPKHGTEYLEFKCRYCCSIAVFYCFGTTHFCESCHEDPSNKEPRNSCTGGPNCALKMMSHAPHGQESMLGCGLCSDLNTF